MPPVPLPFIPRPYVRSPYSQDTRALGSIYGRQGDILAEGARMRGANSQQFLASLAGAFQQIQAQEQAKRLRAEELAIRQAEKDADRQREDLIRKEEQKIRKEERDAAERIALGREQRQVEREAAMYAAENALPGPIDARRAEVIRKFPGTAARLRLEETLPATVTPGAMGEVAPPSQFDVLEPTPVQVRQAEADAAQRERWARDDAARLRDDQRQERGLQATISNQDAMRRIAQQNADTSRMQAETTRQRFTGSGLDSSMPAPLLNALDRSILNITSTKRGPIVNLANRLWTEGDQEGLKDVIRQAAIETENVDTKNQILGRQATLASLRDTRAILKEMEAKGVPTNILTGTVEDVARKLGTSTNPEYVALSNRLMGTLINYRRAATGVAFSARESADYQRMFPNYRNTLPVNMSLIDGLEREMTTYDREYWDHKLGKAGADLVLGDRGGGGADPLGIRK